MKNADAKMVSSVFYDNAILQTISKDGIIKTDELKGFVSSISNYSKDDLDEKLTILPFRLMEI